MDRFADVCEEIARHANKRRKSAILMEYLASLDADELAIAHRLLCDGPMDHGVTADLFERERKQRKASISHSVLRDALLRVCGWDTETVRICREQTGDTGEVIALLMQLHSAYEPLGLREADALYRALATTGNPSELLSRVFARHRPVTVKYFVRLLTGNLRIGLSERVLCEALPRPPAPQAAETLRVVITASEPANGFTIAVRSGDSFVNIGRVDATLSEAEAGKLARVLRSATIERFGRTTLVKPCVVLEIAFRSVRKSVRHKAGYVLSDARIVSWRREQNPEDCDDLERITALYENSR